MSYLPPAGNAVNFQPQWLGGYSPPTGDALSLLFGAGEAVSGDATFGVEFDTTSDFFFGCRGYLVADIVIDAGPTTYRYVTGDFSVTLDVAASFKRGVAGDTGFDVLLRVGAVGFAPPFGHANIGVVFDAAGEGLLVPVASGLVGIRIAPNATGSVPPVFFGSAALSLALSVDADCAVGSAATAALPITLLVQAAGVDACYGPASVPITVEVAAAAARGLVGTVAVPVTIGVSGRQAVECVDSIHVSSRLNKCVVLT